MPTDIFDLDNIASVVRREFNGSKPIRLSHSPDLAAYTIGPEMSPTLITLGEGNYKNEIAAAARSAIQPAIGVGYPEGIFTAVYEAILNAYQHGNKRDPNKNITIGLKLKPLNPRKLVVAVQDQGGLLDPHFVPFALRHRQGMHLKQPMDFYQFSEKKRNDENQGLGTTLMHSYMDHVGYFKSENGGLVVVMTKYR